MNEFQHIDLKQGVFSLKLNHVDYPIVRVSNSCAQGVDVWLPFRLNPNTTVTLNYIDRDLRLKIKARVDAVHMQPSDKKDEEEGSHPGAWIIRLRFYPQNGEQNTLFFMALRKHLDDFDGQKPPAAD